MAISRSDMNRQLYDEGGIITLDQAKEMAPPGESLAYINPEEAALLKSLGGAGEDINGTGIKSYFFKKIFRKAKKAVKKVVKSPIGKAALLGGLGYLGATKLGGFKGLSSMFGKSGGIGKLLGGIKNMGLGKQLGLIGGISGLGGYLASKEAEEEEEPDFSNLDRGEGIDFADILTRARKGDSEFRFLPSGQFTDSYAEGGGVGSLAMNEESVDQKFVSDEAGAIAKKGGGVTPEDMGKLSKKDFDSEENYKRYLRQLNRTKRADGGIMNLGGNEMDLRGGGFVPLGAKEKADDVPARLSKNEFVMTADAVRAAGGGSVDKGADKMYSMMKNLESQV